MTADFDIQAKVYLTELARQGGTQAPATDWSPNMLALEALLLGSAFFGLVLLVAYLVPRIRAAVLAQRVEARSDDQALRLTPH